MNAPRKASPAMERLQRIAAGESAEGIDAEQNVRTQNEREVTRVRTRQRGVFNGTNLKLEVLTQIDGYVQRWFNDVPGKLHRAEQGGWEFVMDGEVTMSESNKVTNKNSDLGGKIRAIVGTTDNNEPLYAYLMKIKKEWHQEDQDDMIGKINETEKLMVKNQGMNTDRIDPSNLYLPNGKKVALEMKRGEFNKA